MEHSAQLAALSVASNPCDSLLSLSLGCLGLGLLMVFTVLLQLKFKLTLVSKILITPHVAAPVELLT